MQSKLYTVGLSKSASGNRARGENGERSRDV